MARIVMCESFDERAAIIAQTCAVVKSAFRIKTYIHSYANVIQKKTR